MDDNNQSEQVRIDQQTQRAIDALNALLREGAEGASQEGELGDKKAAVLAALERGDFTVTYRLPENVEVREVEGEGTIYIIDPMHGCECMTSGDCDNGGCTVTVCGIEFDGFNGRPGDEHIDWQCDDEDLTEDETVDEEIFDALTDHVTIYAEVGEDEVKDLCAAYAGKTREELASQFYILGFDEIPGGDE